MKKNSTTEIFKFKNKSIKINKTATNLIIFNEEKNSLKIYLHRENNI